MSWFLAIVLFLIMWAWEEGTGVSTYTPKRPQPEVAVPGAARNALIAIVVLLAWMGFVSWMVS